MKNNAVSNVSISKNFYSLIKITLIFGAIMTVSTFCSASAIYDDPSVPKNFLAPKKTTEKIYNAEILLPKILAHCVALEEQILFLDEQLNIIEQDLKQRLTKLKTSEIEMKQKEALLNKRYKEAFDSQGEINKFKLKYKAQSSKIQAYNEELSRYNASKDHYNQKIHTYNAKVYGFRPQCSNKKFYVEDKMMLPK